MPAGSMNMRTAVQLGTLMLMFVVGYAACSAATATVSPTLRPSNGGRLHETLRASLAPRFGPPPATLHGMGLTQRLRGGRRKMRDESESEEEEEEDTQSSGSEEDSETSASASASTSADEASSDPNDIDLDPIDDDYSEDQEMREPSRRRRAASSRTSRRDELPQVIDDDMSEETDTLATTPGRLPELRDAADAAPATIMFDAQHHVDAVTKSMQSMRKAGAFTDMVVVCKGGAKLPAHKVVLAAASAHLRAMIEGTDTGEAKTPTKRKASAGDVFVEDTEESCAAALLDFIYTGCIHVEEETLPALLGTAEKLGVVALRDACSQHMLKEMTPSTALRVRALGRSLNAHDLFEAAHHLIMEEFLEVSHTSAFLEVDEQTLKEILSSDDLLVNGEHEVLDALVRWTEAKEAERAPALMRLLGLVRLGLLPLEVLAKKVAACPVIQRHLATNVDWQTMLNKAIAYVGSSPEVRAGMQSSQTRERLGSKGRFLVCVGGRKGSSTHAIRRAWMLDRYQPMTMLGVQFPKLYAESSVPRRINYEWFEVASLHTPRKQVAAAEANGKVYVAGGWDGSRYLRSVEMYDTSLSDWVKAPSMLCARGAFGLGGLDNGDLVAVGGFDGHKHLDSVEVLSAQHNNWTALAPLTVARSGVRVAVVEGKLLAIGGYDGSAVLNTVEEWDAAKGAWTPKSPLISPRRDHAVCVSGGVLYVAGGFNGTADLASVEMYDPATDKWQPVAPMLRRRSGLSLTLLNRKLHALGGYDGNKYLAGSEAFDAVTNAWFKAPEASLPSRMAHFGTALL